MAECELSRQCLSHLCCVQKKSLKESHYNADYLFIHLVHAYVVYTYVHSSVRSYVEAGNQCQVSSSIIVYLIF